MNLNCPKCKSDNTQKVSIVHAAGTSTSSSKTLGAGTADGEIGLLGTRTKGKASTTLADSVKPPQKTPMGGCLFLGMIIAAVIYFGLGWSWWWSLAVMAIFFVLWAHFSVEQDSKFKPKFDLWNKQYLCMRCGDVFVPED